MLRPTPPAAALPIRRQRITVDGRLHTIVPTTDLLEGIAYGFNAAVTYPATEGWATCEAEGHRFCSWWVSPR